MRDRSRELLRRLARGASAASAVYCGVLVVLLIANLLQLRRVDAVESGAMDRLVARLSQNPEDQAFREEIRSFDFVLRRAYFDSRDRLRLGSYLLFGGVVALVGSLKLAEWAAARIEPPDPEAGVAARRIRARRGRRAIALTGAVLGLGTIALSEAVAWREAAAVRRAAPTAAAVTVVSAPGDWPAFRGPGGLGVSGGRSPPVSWDVPAGRGVLWRAEIPLPGLNSPLVWKGGVYVSGSDGTRREVYAYDASSGALRWRKEVREIPGSPQVVPEVTADTGHAAPSLATDGLRLFALFSNGDLVALDGQGAVVWTRSMGLVDSPYGHASSLIASSTLLYVQFDERGGGKLFALDTATGNSVWVVNRAGEAAWSSPALVTATGAPRLVLNGNPFVACYDAATGKEIWRVECMLGDVAPSPAYADGIVFAAASLAPLTALDIKTGAIRWQVADFVPDVSSPVAFSGLAVAATSYGTVSCLDAAKGTLHWSQSFDEGFYASPVVAGGNVYLTDRRGRTRVFAAAAGYREIALNPLGEPSDCTPAFSEGRIYLRGRSSLVCVGAEQ